MDLCYFWALMSSTRFQTAGGSRPRVLVSTRHRVHAAKLSRSSSSACPAELVPETFSPRDTLSSLSPPPTLNL